MAKPFYFRQTSLKKGQSRLIWTFKMPNGSHGDIPTCFQFFNEPYNTAPSLILIITIYEVNYSTETYGTTIFVVQLGTHQDGSFQLWSKRVNIPFQIEDTQ